MGPGSSTLPRTGWRAGGRQLLAAGPAVLPWGLLVAGPRLVHSAVLPRGGVSPLTAPPLGPGRPSSPHDGAAVGPGPPHLQRGPSHGAERGGGETRPRCRCLGRCPAPTLRQPHRAATAPRGAAQSRRLPGDCPSDGARRAEHPSTLAPMGRPTPGMAAGSCPYAPPSLANGTRQVPGRGGATGLSHWRRGGGDGECEEKGRRPGEAWP